MATVVKNDLNACSDYIESEIFRKAISKKVEQEKMPTVAFWMSVNGRWIIGSGLQIVFRRLFPDKFKEGIDAHKIYEFSPEEAEYAGLITKA